MIMATTITINDTLRLDQTSGIQDDDTALDNALNGLNATFRTTLLGLAGSQVLTAGQLAFAASAKGAVSGGTYLTVNPDGATVDDLFFSDGAGNLFDGDQVIYQGNPLKTVAGDDIFLWSLGGDLVIATTSQTSGQGSVVAAFYLDDATDNLSAAVQMVTFAPIAHPNPNSADESIDWTDLLNVTATGSIAFDFDSLRSGSSLWVAVGSASAGILVSGHHLDIDAAGKKTNVSDTIHTSQGGDGATIGVNNQLFDNAGENAVFTLVTGFANLGGTGGAVGDYVVDPKPNDNKPEGIDYSGYLNVTGAGIFLSQSQGNDLKDLTIKLYEAGGGTTPEDGFNYVGTEPSGAFDNDAAIGVKTVTIVDNLGHVVGTWSISPGAGEFASGVTDEGVKVIISGNEINVDGLKGGYIVRFTSIAGETFNRFQVIADAGQFDIGGVEITQGLKVTEPVGDTLFVDDDGPSIIATIVGAPSPTVDESVLGTNDTDSFAAQFTPDFGTDGAATVPTTYALSTPGGASGLVDTASGNAVFLFLEAGKVVGREGTNAADAIAGDKVFEVSVDGSGNVTLDQLRAVVHPTADPDESKTLSSAGLVVLTATAHDKDGDSASAPLNIGTQLIFKDDGPSITSTIVGAPSPTVDESNLAGNDTDSFAAQFSPTYGADGQGATPVTYALSTPGGASGLFDTATGESIVLSLVGGVVQGRTAIGNVLCFTVSVDGSGNVTLDQIRAVVHPTNDPDESKTLASAGLVVLTATAHDKDGDTASAPLAIGTQLIFKDDGPSITATIVGAPTPTVDESNLAGNDTDSFAAQFSPVYGADGQGATPVNYALSTPGGDSGLDDTATGNSVFLFLEGGKVVGREGTDATDAITGDKVFEVSVDGSGNVSLDQLRAIVHPTGDPDESKTLASAGLVVLTATANDKDGDSASAPLNIGTQLIFKDDGPSITASIVNAPTLTVDESILGTDDTDSFAPQFTPVYGADGQGAIPVTYALSTPGGNSGIVDTASGHSVFLFVEGGKVVGREGTDATDAITGDKVFEVSVDASGNVTLDQIRAIVHPTLNPDESKSLLAANLVVLTATAHDKDGDTASAPLNIGQLLIFKDDGPSLPPVGNPASPLVTDDTDLTPDQATLSTDDIFPGAPVFGNDGPNAITPIDFSLRLVTENGNSGLVDTATGKAILLKTVGNDVVGFVDANGNNTIDVTETLEAVRFSLAVLNPDPDPTSYTEIVTFTQTRAVVHANVNDPDEAGAPETIAANLVLLDRIAKDGDGDVSEVVTFDLGAFTFIKDDGPAIGPIPDGLVDFVAGDFVTNSLLGVVGKDPNSSPYSLTAFTASLNVDGVTVTGVAAADGKSVTYWANTNGNGVIGDAGDTAYYKLELGNQGGAGNYTFTVLVDPQNPVTDFDFTFLPSGQSLFGVLVDQDENGVQDLDGLGLLVVGRDAIIKDPGDGSYTNASDTINTSQGGGAVTIGVDNQMFDPGDGAIFVYLDNPDTKSIAINGSGGLTQTSADDADTLGFAGTVGSLGGEVEVVQKQGGAALGMKISAYDVDIPGADNTIVSANDPQSQNPPTTDDVSQEARDFIEDPLLGATAVSITTINVYDRADPNNILESVMNVGGVAVNVDGDGDGNVDNAAGITVTFSLVNGAYVATVLGFTANDSIAWTTASNHDAVLIEGTSGKWDVGGFNVLQGNDSEDQMLEFTAKVTDGDGDFASDTWRIGIDGTGAFDDDHVDGVSII